MCSKMKVPPRKAVSAETRNRQCKYHGDEKQRRPSFAKIHKLELLQITVAMPPRSTTTRVESFPSIKPQPGGPTSSSSALTTLSAAPSPAGRRAAVRCRPSDLRSSRRSPPIAARSSRLKSPRSHHPHLPPLHPLVAARTRLSESGRACREIHAREAVPPAQETLAQFG